MLDALRVTEGRWFSYLCAEPSCCPPEGTPYDPAAARSARRRVFAGQVALPDRAALAAQVSRSTGRSGSPCAVPPVGRASAWPRSPGVRPVVGEPGGRRADRRREP
ncbi:DUF4192 family protein, partial [Micromonospora sp. b486]|uniref:DUF4192 family protein n=1 Tax=Micromonospora sp. b486 TaxID=3053986 RepID=UPI0033904C2D